MERRSLLLIELNFEFRTILEIVLHSMQLERGDFLVEFL
jgi:hypothetical protein